MSSDQHLGAVFGVELDTTFHLKADMAQDWTDPLQPSLDDAGITYRAMGTGVSQWLRQGRLKGLNRS